MFNVKAFLALVLIMLCGTVHADPSKIPFELSVLADPNGVLSIHDAITKEFTSVKGNAYSGGYTRKVHWFKLKIDTETLSDDHFLLEIQPPYLDDVTFYYQTADGRWVSAQQGDQYPFRARAFQYRGFVLDVPADAVAQGRAVLVRLTSTSSSVFNATVWQSDRDLQSAIEREYLVIGMYIGFIVFLIFLNAGVLLYSKDQQLFFYLMYLISALVLIGSINGVFAQFLFADSPMVSDKLTSLGNALVFISASLFYDKVMHIRRVSSPYIWWLTRATLMFFIIIPVSLALGLFTEWMALAINAILFAIVLWLLRALQLWYTQNGSLLLVFSHVWTLFGGLASALALSGFLDPDFWLLNGFQIGMLGTILSLQLLMIQRVIKLDKARISAVAKAQATRESLQQQESMLSMLTHELKTPLSVISMSLQSKAPSDRLKEHAFNAIGNITDVIDRCVHSQKLKHESHPLNIADVDVVSLIGRVVAVKEGSKEIRVMHALTSPIIRTDEIYMNLIVTNLLDNALKYGKDGEPITIDVTQSMNGICMSVSNVVAEDSLPNADKMFERFYRAPTAYKVSGAGLGLFIVKSLTEAISGKIDYQVLDAHKVAFYVCLPQNLQKIKLKDESK